MSLRYTFSRGGDWGRKSPAVGFTEQDWAHVHAAHHKMDELITRHAAIMDRYDPERRVLSVSSGRLVGERDRSRRPACSRSGRCATPSSPASRSTSSHDHAERVQMANLAQMVNVPVPGADAWPQDDRYADVSRLRSLPGPPGRDPSSGEPVVRRPTASRAWFATSACPASRGEAGGCLLSLVNLRPQDPIRLVIDLQGPALHQRPGPQPDRPHGRSPDFDAPIRCNPRHPGPADPEAGRELTVPAKSVNVIQLNP